MLGHFSAVLIPVVFIVFLVNAPQLIRGIRLYLRRSDFRCRMCGNCCRFRVTPLTEEDTSRFEAAGVRDFSEKRGGELCMRRVNGRCVFLRDDRCTVYEIRPNVCRNFPFFTEFGVGYGAQASFCPGMEELEGGRRS